MIRSYWILHTTSTPSWVLWLYDIILDRPGHRGRPRDQLRGGDRHPPAHLFLRGPIDRHLRRAAHDRGPCRFAFLVRFTRPLLSSRPRSVLISYTPPSPHPEFLAGLEGDPAEIQEAADGMGYSLRSAFDGKRRAAARAAR